MRSDRLGIPHLDGSHSFPPASLAGVVQAGGPVSRPSKGSLLLPVHVGLLQGSVGTAGAVKFLRTRRAPAALTVNRVRQLAHT